MNTILYRGWLITTYPTCVGTRISRILLPNGILLTGHAKCMGAYRKYSTNQELPDQNDSSTSPSAEDIDVSQMLNNFPTIQVFKDLHITDNLSLANKALKGVSGVYAILCTVTGAIYIGSSMNIARRLVDHLVTRDTNDHLQNAMNLYGLDNFVFCLVEGFEIAQDSTTEENKLGLLALEQVYLDRLFLLPAVLRYNFLPIAGSSLGFTHTEESKAKMRAAKSGPNHPMFGKRGVLNHMFATVPTALTRQRISDMLKGRTVSEETRKRMSEAQKQVDRSGVNHPGFGKVPSFAHPVYVYSLDNTLIEQFPSKTAAARWLNVSDTTVRYHIKNNTVLQGKYRITTTPIN